MLIPRIVQALFLRGSKGKRVVHTKGKTS